MAKDSKGHGSAAKGGKMTAAPAKALKPIMVQARLGDQFEDIHVKARNATHAVELAKKRTSLKHRFTRFVV